jgi:hypothetical protein
VLFGKIDGAAGLFFDERFENSDACKDPARTEPLLNLHWGYDSFVTPVEFGWQIRTGGL